MVRYSFTFWFYKEKNNGQFADPIIVSVIEPTYGEAERRAREIAMKNDPTKKECFLQSCVELLEQQPMVIREPEHTHE